MVNPSKLEQHERALGRTSSSWGRLAIVVLLGIEALYFSLVAFGNITDYYTNFAFVKGVMSMDTTFQDKDLFERARRISVLGLLMSILLWAGAFLTIGGEWFAMWQSEKWNGTEAAMRNFMVSGIALVIVLVVANSEGRSIDRESEQSETLE